MPDPAASPGPCSHRPPPRSKRHENLSCICPAASGSSSGVLDVLAGSRLAPCMLLRFFSPLSSQGLQLLSTFPSSADTCWLPHTAVLLKRATVFPCCPHHAAASPSGLPIPGKKSCRSSAASGLSPRSTPPCYHTPSGPARAGYGREQRPRGLLGLRDKSNNSPGTTLSHGAQHKAAYSRFQSNFSSHSQAQNSGAGWGRFFIHSEKFCQVDPSGHPPDNTSLEEHQRGTHQAGTASG